MLVGMIIAHEDGTTHPHGTQGDLLSESSSSSPARAPQQTGHTDKSSMSTPITNSDFPLEFFIIGGISILLLVITVTSIVSLRRGKSSTKHGR